MVFRLESLVGLELLFGLKPLGNRRFPSVLTEGCGSSLLSGDTNGT